MLASTMQGTSMSCSHRGTHILSSHSISRCSLHTQQRITLRLRCKATDPDSQDSTPVERKVPSKRAASPDPETGAALKAVWYGAETFGKIIAMGRPASAAAESNSTSSSTPAMSREEVVASLREDYAVSYFVSGKGDMAAYAPDCVFADPFVSFPGVDRFKQNVGNLGALMLEIKLDVYDFQEVEDGVDTRWRFSCILDLPWRPRLAAAGGTRHVLDAVTGRVVRHIERWEVEPSKVVGQLLTPSAKIPTNGAEAFMMALSTRDAGGLWFAISSGALVASGALVGVTLLLRLVHGGEGLPPALELLSGVTLVSAAVTEVVKLTRGM